MRLNTIVAFINTKDNDFFHYKIVKAQCYGIIPIYQDKNGILWTIYVRGKKRLSFPKGAKEHKEHPIYCAVRETKEEVGLENNIHYKFLKTVNIYNDYTQTKDIGTQYFPVKVFDKYELISEDGDEITECKWYSESDVKALTEQDICKERQMIALNYMNEYRKYHFEK